MSVEDEANYVLMRPEEVGNSDHEKFNITVLNEPAVAVLVSKDPEQLRLEQQLNLRRQQLDALKEDQQLLPAQQTIDADRLYKQYIEKLHEYNEIKDATQCLLGKLAELEHCTINEMHIKFDLPVTGDK